MDFEGDTYHETIDFGRTPDSGQDLHGNTKISDGNQRKEQRSINNQVYSSFSVIVVISKSYIVCCKLNENELQKLLQGFVKSNQALHSNSTI